MGKLRTREFIILYIKNTDKKKKKANTANKQ